MEVDSQNGRILDGWGETLMYELMGLYIFGQINLFKLFIPLLCTTPFILSINSSSSPPLPFVDKPAQ